LTNGYAANDEEEVMKDEPFNRHIKSARRRQRAAGVLGGSEKRFQLLVENLADAIALLGPDGRFLYASPAVSRINGYPPEAYKSADAFQIGIPMTSPT
jgi:PAS domain-containing protein